MEDKFKLYDSINTLAVRWLTYNKKTHKLPIGIKQFNRKDKIHLWLLYMMESYSVFNNYDYYYLDCNIFTYIYIRYIKHFRHARWRTKTYKPLMIEVDIFVSELMSWFKQDSSIIIELYNEYWGK